MADQVIVKPTLDEVKMWLTEFVTDSAMLKLMHEADPEAFIELTMKVEDHPEDYEGPCMCKLCQSYGD